MTPPEDEDNLLGPIEDVQLPVDVPTLYRGPFIDLRLNLQLSQEQREDERTRTAFPLITSDGSHVAGVCTRVQLSVRVVSSEVVKEVLERFASAT
jgi:hypothetical protein